MLLKRSLAILALTVSALGAQCQTTGGTSTLPQTPTSTSGTNAPTGATPSFSATLLEQLTLERINRARLLPAAEARLYGIAPDEGIPGQINATPKQPVTFNSQLRAAAADHSADMLTRDYFAHNTPEGDSPFDRIMDNGFAFITAGENLAWIGSTGTLDPVAIVEDQHEALFVDEGIAGRGHRVTMLNGDFREVGISIQRGSFTRQEDGTTFSDSIMQTQDFGTTPASPTYVLGVVYDDANNNGRYDHGEGIAGTGVTLGNSVKSTNLAGGYAFQVNSSGTYQLRFSLGPSQSLTIEEGDANLKIDLVDRRNLVVNFGLGKLD